MTLTTFRSTVSDSIRGLLIYRNDRVEFIATYCEYHKHYSKLKVHHHLQMATHHAEMQLRLYKKYLPVVDEDTNSNSKTTWCELQGIIVFWRTIIPTTNKCALPACMPSKPRKFGIRMRMAVFLKKLSLLAVSFRIFGLEKRLAIIKDRQLPIWCGGLWKVLTSHVLLM